MKTKSNPLKKLSLKALVSIHVRRVENNGHLNLHRLHRELVQNHEYTLDNLFYSNAFPKLTLTRFHDVAEHFQNLRNQATVQSQPLGQQPQGLDAQLVAAPGPTRPPCKSSREKHPGTLQ